MRNDHFQARDRTQAGREDAPARAAGGTADSVVKITCDAKRRTHHQIDRIWICGFCVVGGERGLTGASLGYSSVRADAPTPPLTLHCVLVR